MNKHGGGVRPKCALVYGQMNEPPGARARVALTDKMTEPRRQQGQGMVDKEAPDQPERPERQPEHQRGRAPPIRLGDMLGHWWTRSVSRAVARKTNTASSTPPGWPRAPGGRASW